jgi:demethylmenaquinone methyltransferase/2-methoxy-6-polyprenyl-1,4-benzoquinol methylase
MFDRIAPRYDLLNRLLSFRRDVAWRRALARALPAGESLRVLDLATGTADVLIGLSRARGKIARGVGLDKSAGMIARGKDKIARAGGSAALGLVRGDACGLGFRDGCFDAVSMAFGIRNVPDVPAALHEIHRVIRPGGRALILEFSMPRNALLRMGYLLYFRHVLPLVGGVVSGDAQAYRYLNESVEAFPRGEGFLALMREAGFENAEAMPLSFGIATLYVGEK